MLSQIGTTSAELMKMNFFFTQYFYSLLNRDFLVSHRGIAEFHGSANKTNFNS
jgi:hypothetical protein